LMWTVGIILLMACANVAGLLVSRGVARQREIAIRLALGARRSRILRQLLTESMLLAVLGGAGGLALAHWGARILLAMVTPNTARPAFAPQLNLRVLAFTAGVSLLTGILFGLAPAFRGTRVDLTPALKEGEGGSARMVTLRGRVL